MIRYALHFLSLTIFLYLGVSTAYLLILACAGRWARRTRYMPNPVKKRIAVLIPSFKEDRIILQTAFEASGHNYPKNFFTVLVIADKLKKETVEKLRRFPIQVLEVQFEVSMKAKSIHAALQLLNENDHDIVVILDADNIMHDGCLELVNDAFHNGCKAVQCHRIAKNMNTPIAVLDAVSEEININLLRRGPAALGLSAAPIGSGMAFEFMLLKDIFSIDRILHNPGEDREIDIQLMKKKVRMEFLDDAYVYDEKVDNAGVFENQRIRWLEAQLNHARRFFNSDMKDAPKTILYFNKLFQNFLLPRLLYLIVFALLFLLLVVTWIFNLQLLFPAWEWWASCMIAYLLVILISIPTSHYNFKTLRAVAYIPVLMLSMLKALFKMKNNRKEFLHTSKSFTTK